MVKHSDKVSPINITILTTNHSPEEQKEKLRIQKANGVVRAAKTTNAQSLNDAIVKRVYVKGKESPGLAVSRSIGDAEAHSVGVSEVPDIFVMKLERKLINYLLVMASDGLWNVFSPAVLQKHLTDIQFGDVSKHSSVVDSWQGGSGIDTKHHMKLDIMDPEKMQKTCNQLCQITRNRWNEIFE